MGVVAGFVCEVQFAAVQPEAKSRDFIVDLQVDCFIRLDANDLQK